MTSSSGLNFLSGFGTADNFINSKNAEDAVRQGKSYYLVATLQWGEFIVAANFVQEVAQLIFKSSFILVPTSLCCNIVPLVSLPLLLLAASVKQNHYEILTSPPLRENYPSLGYLPQNLTPKAKNVLNFLAENAGNLAYTTLIVCSIFCACFGNYALPGGALAVSLYRELDWRGFIPRPVSLFLENSLPLVSSCGILLGGSTILLKLYALSAILNYNESMQTIISHTLSSLLRSCLPDSLKGVPLEEYMAPLIEKQNMSFDEINQILDSDHKKYEINPAHCSKWACAEDNLNLPKNYNFEELNRFFNNIDWKNLYPLIQRKLKDDEIFMNFIQEKCPKETEEETFDSQLARLARTSDQAQADYVADWLKSQMQILIEVLCGKRRVKGEQFHLQIAIDNFAKILPYIQDLSDEGPQKKEKEDILLKIAVEAGNYCSLQVKRASEEILAAIMASKIKDISESEEFLQKIYELNIRLSLQEERFRLFQQAIQTRVNLTIHPSIQRHTLHNVHLFDDMEFIGMGFLPKKTQIKGEFSTINVLLWTILHSVYHQPMLSQYREIINSITKGKESHFATYIRQFINDNHTLSDSEKEIILEKYTSANNNVWTVQKTNARFHRLMLVKLGILRLTRSP